MRKLKKEFKVTGAALASLTCVLILSGIQKPVSAETMAERSAIMDGEVTGVGESVFRNDEEETLCLKLKSDHVEVDHGSSFDAESLIQEVSDKSGILPVLRIEGSVDTETDGDYTISYEALNMDGEHVSASVTVTVRYSEEQLAEIEAQRQAEEEAARLAEEAAYWDSVSSVSIGSYDAGSAYAMVEAINAVRASYGLYPYAYADDAGFTAAAIRAQECTYYLSHYRPDGSEYTTALDECGVSYYIAYEVLVAYGSSVEENLNWWLSSSGHSAKILGTSCTTIAIGYCNGIWCGLIY